MKSLMVVVGVLLYGAASGIAFAHEEHTHAPSVKNSLSTSVAFDKTGRLWRVRAKEGLVMVDYSDDKAKHFGLVVSVNLSPENIGASGELRPKIAIGQNGEVYVTWTEALEKPFAGNIKFSRSTDGGDRFTPPIIVNRNRDIITHRFDALTVANDGTVYIAWIDKRDLEAAKSSGQKYVGAAIYYATSQNGGISFDHEYKLTDSTCECCRIALSPNPDGSVAAFWRHIFGSQTREHAVALISSQGVIHTPVRASFDNWDIDACPHHGPAITQDEGQGWHLAWYNGGEQPGLSYARLNKTTWSVTSLLRFGHTETQAAHPDILSEGKQVYLVWREITEIGYRVLLMTSDDSGAHWNKPSPLANTEGEADNPFLVADRGDVYLSWNTMREGYRLINIKTPSPR